MISSMTGFARVCQEIDGVSYIVELKTVNNRYFKPTLRIPEAAAFLETDVERCLRKNIYRGSVSYTLRFKNTSGEPMFDIDTASLNSYLKKLNDLPGDVDGSSFRINLADLLVLPGVIRPAEPEEAAAEVMRQNVLAITTEAIEQLQKMRAEEGKALADDMQGNCELIKEKLKSVSARRETVINDYHDKLKKRVDQLTEQARLKIDEETLAREVAIYADRCDISEEIIRLGSHIEQFAVNSGNHGQTGRKLDFITQEMLREANTIASKASDAQICLDVVDIKTCIERIKEQVQNVE